MNESWDHSLNFRIRRFLNWFPMGLAYAFLYMGRYNLTVAKSALGDKVMDKADFGLIFGIGAVVYGVSFLLNGPLTDKLGGRFTMLIGVFGALIMNAFMGLTILYKELWGWQIPITLVFTILYAMNMYFQSFGAVAIVTVKAPWFHVRERGTFSTIFGVILSLGVYFAFDWGSLIVRATRISLDEQASATLRFVRNVLGAGTYGINEDWWVFFIPSIFLGVMWCCMYFFLRNTPSAAGFADFETGEDTLTEKPERVMTIFKKILTHEVLILVCAIEFMSGVLRNGVMHWYMLFAKEVEGFQDIFITKHWGLMLLIAGVVGSILTGWISDRFFGSKRGPMALILYFAMSVCVLLMIGGLTQSPWLLASAVVVISACVIGVHGILSGTVPADFAGKRNTGATAGIIDGCVYLGTGIQSVFLGAVTPIGDAVKMADKWVVWPLFLFPFTVMGCYFAWQIRDKLPKKLQKQAV